MKISKKLERALSYSVGQRKIKGWENLADCVQVEFYNGDTIIYRDKKELEKLVDELKGVRNEYIQKVIGATKDSN